MTDRPSSTESHATDSPPACTVDRAHRYGLTLIELLVVISIAALVTSILLPAVSSVRQQVKALKCSSNMKSIVFEFQLFADGAVEGGQGDSEALGRQRFRIDDFQEKLYAIDEFWDLGELGFAALGPGSVMICPAGPASLTKYRGFPCGTEAVGPARNASLGFNMRLRRPVVRLAGGSVLAPVAAAHVRADIVNHPSVPLVIDVDGAEAARRGISPFYLAPPVPEKNNPYADGRYWMPSRRHQSRTYVGFVGGHVIATKHPEREPWDWDYQAEVGP